MWLVAPEKMCRKHLLGEHLELHMLAGCLEKGKNIRGFIEHGFVDPSLLLRRHEQVVKEMERRGYNHCSPIGNLPRDTEKGHIDSGANRVELCRRCAECRGRHSNQ
jgi:ribosomal protein L44E